MTGLEGRFCSDEAVNPEVAPCTGPCSWTGELMISSREGMGRLLDEFDA
jgi:hypothetical protein